MQWISARILRNRWLWFLPLSAFLLTGFPVRAQPTPDQAAALVLTSARKAYNDKQYTIAATRFREFLAKYGGHKDAPAARFGLALSLLDGTPRDYAGAAGEFQNLAGNTSFAEHPFVVYYLGVARRGLGLTELSLAKPNDRAQRRANANQRFDEAARHFDTAVKAFTARVKMTDAAAKALPADLEWAARARCDLAEMQLRLGRAKEARVTAEPFLRDNLLSKSRYRGLGQYHHGYACFLLKDYSGAAASLNQLTPSAGSANYLHARYLLGRIHHMRQESAKASEYYAAVLADFKKRKQAAIDALRRPDLNAQDKVRLEALVNAPPPDYAAGASFYSGELLYEAAKIDEALALFAGFSLNYPTSGLLSDASLRQGFCQVQLKHYADAVKTLQPIADREPRLADQALLWIGKAQVSAADPANPQAYAQGLNMAMATLHQAANRAQQLFNTDPDARHRKGEIFLELAATQELARQYPAAAGTYQNILNEKLSPQREAEILLRQATAQQHAGNYAAADDLLNRLRQSHAQSPLVPAALLCWAENAYLVALTAANNPNLPNRAQTLAKLTDDAAKRYQEIIDKQQNGPVLGRARCGLALVYCLKHDFARARSLLEEIPPAERKNDLAVVSYVLADCVLHLAPAKTEDPDTRTQAKNQLQQAADLFDGFLGAQSRAAEAPDALFKLGLCQQRLAELQDGKKARIDVLASARSAFEKLMLQFPTHSLQPRAIVERARCLALLDNPQGAIEELQRFGTDAVLKNTAVAPLAVLELAVLYRKQSKPEEAAKVLEECRRQHEPALQRDPERAEWLALMYRQQGLALREAGKLANARDVFDGFIRLFPSRADLPEVILLRGQSVRDEAMLKIEEAKKKLARTDLKPPELADARRLYDEGQRMLPQTVQYLVDQANALKSKQPVHPARARMLYDAAWCYRVLAEPEVANARVQAQQALLAKLRAEAIKNNPKEPNPVIPLPNVRPAEIKLQPSEERSHAQYKLLIEAFPDLALPGEARLELAELHAEREDYEAAFKLLDEALTKNPSADLRDRIRIRQATGHAGKNNLKTALDMLDGVAQSATSALAGQAQYRAGEILFARQDFKGAAARLAAFRDEKRFQSLAGVSDPALLRLGQAYERLGEWKKSQEAYELVTTRFPRSSWALDARYGAGHACQNLREYDKAVAVYTPLAASATSETAARAQFQIGLCRLEQKRHGEATAAFLLVAFTFDFPDWSAAALCEAARALSADKKPLQAEQLLRRVLRDYPQSQWAAVAKKRLEEMK
jgi:TolA-binding protein